MKRKKLKPLKPNHRNITRRSLLGQGVISMSAAIAMPSPLFLISQRAYAAGCDDAPFTKMMPFLCVDLGGGANLSGANLMVGGKGGQLDFLPEGSYATLGLSSAIEPSKLALNQEMGLAFHPESRLLSGILNATSAPTRGQIDGGVFCTVSADDTGNNPHNPTYWIAKTGLQGQVVNLVGTSDTISGGRASAPASSIDPTKAPARIGNAQDVVGLIAAGQLGELLGEKGVNQIIQATNSMSQTALARFHQKSYTNQIKDLLDCAYSKSKDQLSKFTADAVDPRQDQILSEIFDMNDQEEQRAGAIAKLLMDGLAGGATLSLGGYDYHNNPRTTTDPRDERAGTIIGKTLEYAARKKQDIMIYAFSDGGISCRADAGNMDNDTGRFNPSSDSGTRSLAFSMIYRAEGARPVIRQDGRQIGSYIKSGAVDSRDNLISNSVENLSKAVVANYLALYGREGELEKIVGDDPFKNDLDKYLLFSKMFG